MMRRTDQPAAAHGLEIIKLMGQPGRSFACILGSVTAKEFANELCATVLFFIEKNVIGGVKTRYFARSGGLPVCG